MNEFIGFPKNLPEQYKTDFALAHNRIVELQEEVNSLRRQLYGSKSERYAKEEQAEPKSELFNEAEKIAAEEKVEEEISTATEEKPETPAKKKRVIEKIISKDIPREVKIHDLPSEEKTCPHDGTPLTFIGEDVSEKIGIIPAKLKIVEHRYKKYACPCCESYLIKARAEPSILPGSMAEPSLLAAVITGKYLLSLPLYRQEMYFTQMGVELPRNTLARWIITAAGAAKPLVKRIKYYLLSGPVLHCDETPMQVLKGTGKKATSTTYMWVMRSGLNAPIASYFEYFPTRGSTAAHEFLENYKGYLQVDGYDGYNSFCLSSDVVRVGCWAHVRRKFENAYKVGAKNGTSIAEEFLSLIKELFKIEQETKEKSYEERLLIRKQKAPPILQKIRKLIDEKTLIVPPKSKLGEALGYIANEWEHLLKFLEEGRVSLSNNIVENAIRPFAVGRKNWLFADTVKGAEASAILYTLVICAKENGLKAKEYLEDVFTKLPTLSKNPTPDELEPLLPWNWIPASAEVN